MYLYVYLSLYLDISRVPSNALQPNSLNTSKNAVQGATVAAGAHPRGARHPRTAP